MTTETILAIEMLVVAAALLGVMTLLTRGRPDRRGYAVAAGAALLTIGVAAVQVRSTAHRAIDGEALTAALPRIGRADLGFASSGACRSCHPDQYDSWHRSYHRTMTQVATRDAVAGDFADVTLPHGTTTLRLFERDGGFWADMIDPDWMLRVVAGGGDPLVLPDPPRAEKRVVMTTGSHHYQACWVASDHGRMLIAFPYAWLIGEERWVPRESVFLRPPDADRLYQQWNNNCYRCHSVHGDPGLDAETRVFHTSAAELGVACEACHGPAADHVRANRDPARRYARHLGDRPDATIVQPARLDAARSAEVCGQCHGILMPLTEALASGERYRAGDLLAETEWVVRGTDANLTETERERWRDGWSWLLGNNPRFHEQGFWPDGMIRLAGREYNGLVESPCYGGGAFSCLSCHSIHESDPEDQLAAGMDGDEACTQCHERDRYATEDHTHHPLASAGSRCYECHMPRTTWGLLKAIRSHQVDSPTVQASVEAGRPNACNLCHLDRPLAWTARHLDEWYGTPAPELGDDDRTVAASVRWALSGDAAQRAIAAWHMGWAPAREASKDDWIAPYLARLLDDPYTAVRSVAAGSLRALPGYEDLAYDFLAPAPARAAAARAAHERWTPPRDPERPGVLLLPDGALDRATFERLFAGRDDRDVELME